MLREIIDQFYVENQKNREQTHFYITDAGKCPRAVFFKFKNVPRELMDARILRVFEHGEYIHRNIFNVLYRLRIGVTTEIPIPAQEIISGRADAILCINNENYVLDIKSMNSMIFRNLVAPKEENVYQIQLYLHYFNIKKGILLYIDKDQQNMKEFVVNYDEKLVKGLIDGFQDLKVKVETNIVPSRLADYPKNWQCQYCQFREVCKAGEGEEMSWQILKDRMQS
ncbi:MAG: Dna2/Cas4 domain-containing protein [Candidatus Staskawiczbacteria bacterium]|jgi:CRISPR/Cas system-associated exonuclease Cas4 (RecB family)